MDHDTEQHTFTVTLTDEERMFIASWLRYTRSAEGITDPNVLAMMNGIITKMGYKP